MGVESEATMTPGIDFTTEADLVAEEVIILAIRSKFPGDKILSEELSKKEKTEFDGTGWVIDPIDGTVNFSRSQGRTSRRFVVSVAYAERWEPLAGAVYAPSEDELFWAQRGSGAFLNEERIAPSPITALRNAVVEMDWSWNLDARKGIAQLVQKLHQHVRQILIRGTAAYGLCDAAAGRVDAYIHTGLNPWDWAAGLVIAQEAGCIARTLEGKEMRPDSRAGIIAAPGVFEKIFEIVKTR
jgi:myo-inositol-1(or 4)-monophosphatase